ncbi:MAG: patatin [Cytophagales bacterium]|nr:patatin [Cytophaga sp.]
MKKYLKLIILLISIATLFSGILQLVKPDFVLQMVGAEITPTTKQFFAIIGMFMALFGGLMIHTLYAAVTSREAVLWSGLQKIGAFTAVSIGYMHGLFIMMAMGVALFDLFSGILFIIYWIQLGKSTSRS